MMNVQFTRVVLSVLFSLLVFADLGPAADAAQVAELVEQALVADEKGESGKRDDLLGEALRLDPESELAHWLSGHVYFQGKWRSLDSIARMVSSDPRWKQYRERLAAADDGLESQASLARWCRAQGLENETKWHWYQVLRSDPENREALGNLQLKRYQGGYYTKSQIEEIKRVRDQAERDFARYAKQFKAILAAAEAAKGEDRVAAAGELAKVNDPAAIPALMDALVSVNGESQNDDLAEQVGQAVVAALGSMREHQATLELVAIAINARHPAVRHMAAENLRYREPTDYMPILMASLAAPLESTFSVSVAPSGHVTLIESLYEQGPLSARSQLRSSNYFTHLTVISRGGRGFDSRDSASGRSRPLVQVHTNRQGDIHKAAQRVAATEQAIAQENSWRLRQNQRLQQVLETVTDQQLGADPEAWWNSWKQYNELYTPEELPVNEYVERDSTQLLDFTVMRVMSCFIAGTPVWTQGGMKPIEQIAVGEMVLSRDPISGRLEYRPVIETTIRPATPVVELEVGEETIVATRGHRFWVAGEGWRMAKLLSAGTRLLAVTGSVDLSSVQPREDEIAYNLVVGEFHTYFVGASRLLVHDNNCPVPTTASVPGSNRE